MSIAAGILLVDKPLGVTSHDVVDWVRFVTRGPTGHAGTLDPAASGLLVVLLGAATKLSGAFTSQDKVYEARFRLGVATRSGDLDGDVTARIEVDDAARARAHEALRGLVGRHELPPPDVSAVRVDGERAHVRARRGEALSLPPRPMIVHGVRDVAMTPEGDLQATLQVSKGTYIRSLAVDLGRRVGLPCTLSALRRTHSGEFSLDGRWPVLDDLVVEPRTRPDGVPAVRIRLRAPTAPVGAASRPSGSDADRASEGDSVRAAPNGGSLAESRVPTRSRDEARARIAALTLPLVSVAPFPCVYAEDAQSRTWLRRLSLGQRLSVLEEGLCERFGRAPQVAPGAPPMGGSESDDVPEDLVAIYGALDDSTLEAAQVFPPEPVGAPARDRGAEQGETLLVLCAWSATGDRLEPRRTVRFERSEASDPAAGTPGAVAPGTSGNTCQEP